MASQDARLSKFKADFKQQQSEMTNKVDTVLKAIIDQITGALPSDMVKNPKLNVNSTSSVLSPTGDPQCSSYYPNSINVVVFQRDKPFPEGPVVNVLAHASMYNAILDKYVESLKLSKNGSAFIQGEMPKRMEDPGLFTLPCRLGDSKPFDTLADLRSCVNIIPLYLFKKLNKRLLEETDHVFGLADGTKSYPVGIVRDAEVHIRRVKLLNVFYIIDMKKDLETPLLEGRGFLATANAFIDCRKARIVVRKGSLDGVGAQTLYYARKEFIDYHLPGEWEIARDGEINPFKDVLVFRRIMEFLGAIPINLIMSSVTSAVTYTSVYTDSEPGRAFWGADDEEISEGGIPRVIVLGYDRLPIQPVAPPSPDYIPGLEDPQTPPVSQDEDEREPMFVQAHDPDYVPEPIYPEYIPLEDEHEFPAEEQPLPPVDSPTAESPGYVTESDPEEDPEEYEDDEIEDGPVDYPMDGGDDGDNDDSDSSRDDANNEDEYDKDGEEEEEEHLAPADSTTVVPVDEHVFLPEGTEPVILPPSTDITIGARITVRPQTSISLPPEAEVERLLAMTTPSSSPSPPISLSPPSAGEYLARCMAPPAHSSPLLPSSGCPTQIQTFRMTSTQALIDAVTAALPSPPLPPLPLSLYIPPPVDHRDKILESK
ncbi:reverse transcriptase domain-containing protein [Tanacetum coccineum]